MPCYIYLLQLVPLCCNVHVHCCPACQPFVQFCAFCGHSVCTWQQTYSYSVLRVSMTLLCSSVFFWKKCNKKNEVTEIHWENIHLTEVKVSVPVTSYQENLAVSWNLTAAREMAGDWPSQVMLGKMSHHEKLSLISLCRLHSCLDYCRPSIERFFVMLCFCGIC